MVIDLTPLISKTTDVINIDEQFVFSEDMIKDSEILALDSVKVVGELSFDEERNLQLVANVSGTMTLADSISLEDIFYPFSFEINEKIEEKAEKVANTLDITDILWQNIVLEVPLQLTEVQDLSQYRGDGWKLVSEDEMRNANNPFQQLKDIIGEE